jgi:iron(III) transport system permease protein
MKELPLTLILRPFNFETLSTSVYQLAKDELLEQAAPESLMIVIAGLLPIWLINSTQRD